MAFSLSRDLLHGVEGDGDTVTVPEICVNICVYLCVWINLGSVHGIKHETLVKDISKQDQKEKMPLT